MTNKGCFKKGHVPWNKGLKNSQIPWNKGLKGIHLSPESQFDGSLIGNDHPSWKGGVQKPKGDSYHLWTGRNNRVRRPRFEWEKHVGKIPKGHVIWHINGDKTDDRIENLECISRGEMMKRNATGRYYENTTRDTEQN